ncbi:EAL domain-containing protein [Thiomonas sp.]|uniref:EAL domain-containing protein n=1 Tax=Thiomonas sp. TaxID=2047785 RepID=UPI00262373E5|nr:EAL domain-containing protein [Thiomonas sp.]
MNRAMVLAPLSHEEIYGPAVAPLLHELRHSATGVTQSFAQRFYGSLMQAGETRTLLDLLGAQEFQRLQSAQTGHLLMLLDPRLDADAHRDKACRVGRVHALVGVDMMWLIDAYNLYQQALHDCLHDLPRGVRLHLQHVLDRRLLLDLQAQSAGYQQVDEELSRALAGIQQVAMTARSTIDLYQGVLQSLCAIDGVLAANVSRLGAHGALEIEALDGALAQAQVDAIAAGEAPGIRVGPEAWGDGQAEPVAAYAWRTAQVTSSDAYRFDPATEPWHALGTRLGLRSSVAIPLPDETGQTFAMLSVYSRWPGFFRARGRQLFLQHVQQTLALAALRHVQGKVVAHALRQHYRDLVATRGMVMVYQPIVDLRSGALRKVEALGRLVQRDGTLVSPGEFLPTLGNHDLLRLFEFGIEQVCRDLAAWHAQGLRVSASLNLPPQGIGDPAFREVLLRSLRDARTDGRFLELEILESQEFKPTDNRDHFLRELKALGIRLVQDDLGSGHSSLLRLDTMPFDEVKIDQALVRRAAHKHPHRAFGFIYYLTQLAHELGASVTVEGLENLGLIEAAAVMGADCGQGFGIARPMPMSEVARWAARPRHAVDPLHPRTPWGALAGYLLWDRELKALDPWPELAEDFVRAPCRVQRYIEGHDPGNTSLQQLLDKNHAVALRGSSGRMYRLTRRDLIQCLAELGRKVAAAG